MCVNPYLNGRWYILYTDASIGMYYVDMYVFCAD